MRYKESRNQSIDAGPPEREAKPESADCGLCAKDEKMSTHAEKRWCIFTSAGDKNSVRLWLDGAAARQWDLVFAYCGDDDDTCTELTPYCIHAFRIKVGKFQNL